MQKIGGNKRGKDLKSFLESLESKGVRVVDRARQRAIGEALILFRRDAAASMSFYDFTKDFFNDAVFRQWFEPMLTLLRQIHLSAVRQKILTYGAVLHAMIDHLDPDHLTAHARPGWPNKLTRKSRSNLDFRVFGIYLPFVKQRNKYVGDGRY